MAALLGAKLIDLETAGRSELSVSSSTVTGQVRHGSTNVV